MRTLLVSREPIVGNWLPRCGVGNELMKARPDTRVSIERAETDTYALRIRRVAAVHGRPALAAEPLLPATLGPPRAQPVLARDDPERARLSKSGRRRARTGAPLATRAMAIDGGSKRCADLEPNGAATTTAG